MISVNKAWRLIAESISPVSAETVPIDRAFGRCLSSDVEALVSHPRNAVSAMDGYAVAWTPSMEPGARWEVVGEAAAGRPFRGSLGHGAVRVFTGSVVPAGADHVIIQEHVDRSDNQITLTAPQPKARNIRSAGGDFSAGDVLVPDGTVLTAPQASLLAAAGLAEIPVRQRPKVALFTNGDELVTPGNPLEEGQIYNSIAPGLAALLSSWGADVEFLGTATDEVSSVERILEAGAHADLVVPVGGASVGDYDVVKKAASQVFDPVFAKVSVKPGKPVWFSRRESRCILGLPGNPASAFVCAHLFLRPALKAYLGNATGSLPTFMPAKLTQPLPANGPREEYIRSKLAISEDGSLTCTPLPRQDSSLLSTLALSQGLLRRAANSTSTATGSTVEVVSIGQLTP